MRQFTARLLVVLSAFTFGAILASAQNRAFSTVPVRTTPPLSQDSSPSIVIGPNVNITNKSGAQSETGVAVDPTNPNHIYTSVNDLTSTAAVYESLDGGATFTKSTSTPADSATTLGWPSTPPETLSSPMNVPTNALPTRR